LFRRWRESLNPKALDELYAYVDVMIADRCRKPGEELTVDDLRAIVASLVSGAD
jgi:hypothetical protein